MADSSWEGRRGAFREATLWFVEITRSCTGRWDEVGLGEWTIRDLVGHTSRALLTVEAYLDLAGASVVVPSAAQYFTSALATRGEPAAVAQRGRDAGAALGPDVVRSVSGIASRVLDRIVGERSDALVATPVGGMYLQDYLPTRTFELTVHTCDLAVALGLPLDVPQGAAIESLDLMGQLAARNGQGGAMLLAATGRHALPPGFTVL